jgi:hypothetical protein
LKGATDQGAREVQCRISLHAHHPPGISRRAPDWLGYAETQAGLNGGLLSIWNAVTRGFWKVHALLSPLRPVLLMREA